MIHSVKNLSAVLTNFFSSSPMLQLNKLECLSVSSFFRLILYLRVMLKLWACTLKLFTTVNFDINIDVPKWRIIHNSTLPAGS